MAAILNAGEACMSLRVLIVEDEPIIALHLTMIIEDAGHSVIGMVFTMEAAIETAGREAVDVAIMDIALSGRTDGIQTARRLSDDFDVRSLFVTVHFDRREEAMQPAWQPLGFVVKPFSEEQIVRALGLAN
ncbi:response regulator [Aureimonas leprariae]|uniref:Response regulator n=1 Tax=Plantimonas leprariae TaxID=2615207 RepID=A0A7V7PPR7_9HYPH|nr:response regulator [Aureimonas leprariae]KAB0680073.1 response regulator [Aureimonas leprariae]